MPAAVHTPGLNNPPTGADRLLAVARWLVLLLLIHWLIARGRQLAAALYRADAPDDTFLAKCFGTTDRAVVFARITRALRRAAALEADLLDRRPTEHGFPIEARRAIADLVIDICRDLGFLRPASRTAPRVRAATRSPSFARARVSGRVCRERPVSFLAVACPGLRAATGPPPNPHLAREAGEVALVATRRATRVRDLPNGAGQPAGPAIPIPPSPDFLLKQPLIDTPHAR